MWTGNTKTHSDSEPKARQSPEYPVLAAFRAPFARPHHRRAGRVCVRPAGCLLPAAPTKSSHTPMGRRALLGVCEHAVEMFARNPAPLQFVLCM